MSAPIFVGRERELRQLQAFLDQARAGQSQICFIAGEAGAGKSSLLEEFIRRAVAGDSGVVVAIGTCSSQTGTGDPYLPFRTVLAQLTGAVAAQLVTEGSGERNAVRVKELLRVSANALLEVAPDLLGLFLPGGSIAGKAAKVMADKAGVLDKIKNPVAKPSKPAEIAAPELDQTKLQEQYTAALQTLAQQKPLCLVLEDLHWADSASLDLLFHLSRQLKASAVLIIGTFRPDDVALGRDGAPHPLEAVINEVKRYRGQAAIDLTGAMEREGRAFVDLLVDAEPNRLGEHFRQALFDKTCGHPLFAAELLRSLQENGDLIQDADGRWIEMPTLHWETLPTRVEGVIQTRLAGLPSDLCDLLRCASVEGVHFDAQTVARVQNTSERDVLKALSRELDRRHRLVREETETRVGRQIISAYQFAHALFQQFLYGDLSSGERRMLHGDIARVLESLYAGNTDAIAVQLAHHYEQALEDGKAIEYLSRAGTLAHQMSAFREATSFYERALALISPNEVSAARVGLLLQLGHAYYHWGKFPEATRPLMDCLDLSKRTGESKADADARYYLGVIALRSGKRMEAKTYLEASLAVEQEMGDGAMLAAVYCALGGLAARQGDYTKAKESALKGVSILQELNDPTALANAYNALGTFSQYVDGFQVAEEYYRQALDLFQRHKDRVGCSKMLNNLGSFYYKQGRYGEAAQQYEQGLSIQRELNNPDLLAWVLTNAGELARVMGDLAKARAYELEGLSIAQEIGMVPVVLEILFTWAKIEAPNDSCAAAELCGLVRSHPQSDHNLKQLVEQFLQTWNSGMTPDALAVALERGRTRDLASAIDELRRSPGH